MILALAIGVLTAAGIAVRFFSEPIPTPLVAHAASADEAGPGNPQKESKEAR